MSRQFAALRVMGTIFKILGWLFLIVGVLAAIGALVFGFALTDRLGSPGSRRQGFLLQRPTSQQPPERRRRVSRDRGRVLGQGTALLRIDREITQSEN